jgi:cytochrome c oxidase assembly protein subunit 15
LTLRTGNLFAGSVSRPFEKLRPWLWLGLAILVLQILLGGWTSTNYAAAACIEFPTCYAGSWWPVTNFQEAFTLWRGLGVNYEFGVLDNPARVAIHMTHRVGALVVLIYMILLSSKVMLRASNLPQVALGVMLHLLILAQVGLGIAVVLNFRQLEVGVAHNAVAALLLLTIVTIIHLTKPPILVKAQH